MTGRTSRSILGFESGATSTSGFCFFDHGLVQRTPGLQGTDKVQLSHSGESMHRSQRDSLKQI